MIRSMRSPLYTACALLSTALFLCSCAADGPRERNGDDEAGYTPQPMTRTAPQAGDERSAGTATEGSDRGAVVYKQYCVTCHMANGQGMSGVYPPLAGSEFLADKQKTIDAVANGLEGKITVKGKEYNNVMPPIPGSYSNADIAAVVNYVVATFGNGAWTATEAEVAAIRKK